MTLRFAADEHIPLAAVRGLVARGLDVVRFQDVGRRGLADEDQLPWATSAGRVVVTHDPDFPLWRPRVSIMLGSRSARPISTRVSLAS